MSTAKTGIEWTGRTWNPVRGCSLVSPGCTNCYAMKEWVLNDAKGGDPSQWPEELRVREMPR